MSLRQRLARMIGGESRSIENPNVPLTAEQLVSVLDLGPSAAGVTVNEQTATAHATVMSCVKILAETLAMLPLKVYERVEPRGRSMAVDHPIYQLLHDKPNPELSSFIFREMLQAHLGLWGNAYAEIESTKGGRIIALWPIAPWRVEVVRVNGQKGFVVSMADGSRVPLASDRVLHIPGFGYDGLKGLSPIGTIRQSIGLAIAAEMFGAKLFANDARPGGIITRPKEVQALSPEAAKAFKESWEAAHQGLNRAHRVAILEEGMQWQQMGIPPNDAQFLETRTYQRREICGFYRVPVHMVGDLERATFSNIEQQGIDFVTHTMGPWLSRWEAVLMDLFSEADRQRYYAEFLVTALLKGDQAARAAYYTQRFNIGSLSPNDIRELENENPVPGGDTYFVQGAYVPIEQAKAPKAPAAPVPPDPTAARALLLDVGERMAKRQADQLRKLHKKGENEWIPALESHEIDYKNALSRALTPVFETFFSAGPSEMRGLALVASAVASQFAASKSAEIRSNLAALGHADAEKALETWESEQRERVADGALAFLSSLLPAPERKAA